MYLVGAVVLTLRYRRADDPIVRQQLKWLRNGAVLGVLPFARALRDAVRAGRRCPAPYMKLSVLSLVLIPLTWAYAIVRYRLMDVDIIFQQGYVYTLATLCVLGVFYGMVFSLGQAARNFEPGGRWSLLMLIATFVFQPIRNWIQERLDRYYFYQDRYDYRRTLIEFARELSSETDLDAMLARWRDRLLQTLSIRHLAFFLCGRGPPERFRLQKAVGVGPRGGCCPAASLDLSFLKRSSGEPYLFFERTRHQLDVVSRDWPASVRQHHRGPGPDLLHALHGARPHHRLPGREPHRQGRLPVQRRRGTAADAGRLRGHRDRERARSTARCSARWRSTSG